MSSGKYVKNVEGENNLTVNTTGKFCIICLPGLKTGILNVTGNRGHSWHSATYSPLNELLQDFYNL